MDIFRKHSSLWSIQNMLSFFKWNGHAVDLWYYYCLVVNKEKSGKMYSSMEYTYLLYAFFVILQTWLVLMFLHCKYKSTCKVN